MQRSSFVKIFIFALIMRILFFGFLVEKFGYKNGMFFVDAGYYTVLAQNIANDNGFSLSENTPFLPDVYRTPGYPLFLAVFYKLFGTFWPANLFQVFINSFVPVMVMWLAWQISTNKRASYAAGILTAIEPQLIMHQISVATEGIFIFLLTLFVVLMIKYVTRPSFASAILSGLVFALSTMTRPYFLYFLPFAVFFLWLRARKTIQWKKIILIFACFLLPSTMIIFPWMLRNKYSTGHFILSTSGWYNMYTRLSVTVYATANHLPFSTVFNQFLEQMRADGFTTQGKDEELYNPNLIPVLKERSLAILKRYPKESVLIQPISILAIFTHDNLLNLLAERNMISAPNWPPVPLSALILQKNPLRAIRDILPYIHGSYILPYVMRMIWLFFLLCALFGVRASLSQQTYPHKIQPLFIATVIIYFVIVTLPIAAAIDSRMRMIFEPVYFIFVSIGMAALLRKLKLPHTEKYA